VANSNKTDLADERWKSQSVNSMIWKEAPTSEPGTGVVPHPTVTSSWRNPSSEAIAMAGARPGCLKAWLSINVLSQTAPLPNLRADDESCLRCVAKWYKHKAPVQLCVTFDQTAVGV
jgi:hypothetical protein